MGKNRTRFGRGVAVALGMVLLAGACTSSDDETTTDDASSTSTTTGDGPSTTAGDTTAPGTTGGDGGATTSAGPATGEPIRIGITHVDTVALAEQGIEIEQGDYGASYTAIIDDINANGGINGRPIEAAIDPFNPAGTEGSEEACVRLAEDEQVVLMTGRFLGAQALCPLSTYGIPLATGDITPDLLAQAQAPWISTFPDTDGPEEAVRAMHERGALDGTVAVYADVTEQETAEQVVIPTLEELGVEPVEVGTMDAPQDDPTGQEAIVQTIGERFEAAGADTVVLIGGTARTYLAFMADNTSYRPQLLFTSQNAVQAFASSDSVVDTSILEGSLSAGPFGPDQARFEEETMQECIGILEAAGQTVPSPDETSGDDSNQGFSAAFRACPDMYLVRAWLEAAGDDISNDGLQAAIDAGFEVKLPGEPDVRRYGPDPDLDGNPTVYLYGWDVDNGQFVLDDA